MSDTLPNQGMSYDPIDHGLDSAEIAYRKELGDGLEAIFGRDSRELADRTLGEIADALNELDVPGPKGRKWTESLLEAELHRLSR